MASEQFEARDGNAIQNTADGPISCASDDPVLRGERARAGVAGAHSQSMALSSIPRPTSRLLNLVPDRARSTETTRWRSSPWSNDGVKSVSA